MAVVRKVENSREKVRRLLRELFQFDAQDLDFGIYRILNFKRNEIERFIEKDLIEAVEAEFKEYAKASVVDLQKELEKQKAEINRDFGDGTIDGQGHVTKHKDAPKVLDYTKKADELKNAEVSESQMNEVFNHIFEFFSRYYDKGDFISKRRYGGKEKYYIPYNGEEVSLYWANKDQYYVKTAEYFRNYHFKSGAYRVNILLREIDAESDDIGEERKYFILCESDFLHVDDEKKNVNIFFEYKKLMDEEVRKFGTRNIQEELTKGAIDRIFSEINNSSVNDELKLKVDEGKTLLGKHLNVYVERNTSDYFIHRDLKAFLTRELEFFIKNEVLDLDMLDNFDEKSLHISYAKVRAIRGISNNIIDFLSQIEDFQKMLWEKKKFVLATDYIVTIDKIPPSMMQEVLKNHKQIDEWEELGFGKISTENDLKRRAQSLLHEQDEVSIKKISVDTKYFDSDFKTHLLEELSKKGSLDQQIDGILIKSENWQALNLLQNRFEEKVKAVYIDPPYNTDASAIIYKNDYKDSSWLSLMENRLQLVPHFMTKDGIICVAIDDEEFAPLKFILSSLFKKGCGIAAVRSNPAGRKTKGKLASAHEYAIFYGKSDGAVPGPLEKREKALSRYPLTDDKGRYAWANFIRSGSGDKREDRPKLYYPIFVNEKNNLRVPKIKWDDYKREYIVLEKPHQDEQIVYPILRDGERLIEKRWHRGHDRVNKETEEFRVRRTNDGGISIDFKTRMDETAMPITWWDDSKYASANYGAIELKNLFGEKHFDFPKSIQLVVDCLRACNLGKEDTVIDFFAGSGTTVNATLQLNNEDDGHRKFIIVEMADYFDSIIIPRLKKNLYSLNWKDGKPQDDDGLSVLVKYFSLEQYEDTLNNVIFLDKNKTIQETLDGFEDYFLKNMLEFETRGTPTRLSVQQFQTPFEYKIWVTTAGDKKIVKVDLVETFNYLLGIAIEKIQAFKDSDRIYHIVFGKKKDENIGIIWRNLKDIDLKSDKKIIENVILAGIKLDRLFINGDSLIERAEPIEPEFKRLMGA